MEAIAQRLSSAVAGRPKATSTAASRLAAHSRIGGRGTAVVAPVSDSLSGPNVAPSPTTVSSAATQTDFPPPPAQQDVPASSETASHSTQPTTVPIDPAAEAQAKRDAEEKALEEALHADVSHSRAVLDAFAAEEPFAGMALICADPQMMAAFFPSGSDLPSAALRGATLNEDGLVPDAVDDEAAFIRRGAAAAEALSQALLRPRLPPSAMAAYALRHQSRVEALRIAYETERADERRLRWAAADANRRRWWTVTNVRRRGGRAARKALRRLRENFCLLWRFAAARRPTLWLVDLYNSRKIKRVCSSAKEIVRDSAVFLRMRSGAARVGAELCSLSAATTRSVEWCRRSVWPSLRELFAGFWWAASSYLTYYVITGALLSVVTSVILPLLIEEADNDSAAASLQRISSPPSALVVPSSPHQPKAAKASSLLGGSAEEEEMTVAESIHSVVVTVGVAVLCVRYCWALSPR